MPAANNTQTTKSEAIQPTTASQAPTIYPDLATVSKVFPHVPKKNFEKYLPYLLKAMAEAGLKSKNQLVAFLCNMDAETLNFACTSEVGKGGGRYGAFYGRGFTQLTFKDNYAAASRHFKIDLLSDPDRANEPELAAKISVWFYMGGTGAADIRPYAEKGDWYACRAIINAGNPKGKVPARNLTKYNKSIPLAVQYFQSGVDPSVASLDLGGDYGMGCVDTGGASSQVMLGQSPSSTGDAIAYALGIQNLQNWRSHELKGVLAVSSFPESLKLIAQSGFNCKGFGEDLDGEYVVEELTFYGDETLEADLLAYRPDPNAPNPMVFKHDANAPLTDPPLAAPPTPGDFQNKIWASAQAAKGKSTAAGPDGGRNACAWSVNRYVLKPTGIKPLGGGENGSPSVAMCLSDLKNGRGRKIDKAEAVPGDIWIDAEGNKHIGICSSNGCRTILSNSPSRAAFIWESSIEFYTKQYGQAVSDNIFRIIN